VLKSEKSWHSAGRLGVLSHHLAIVFVFAEIEKKGESPDFVGIRFQDLKWVSKRVACIGGSLSTI
jgi:hypothetical protein